MLERLIDLGSVPLLILALLVAGFGVPLPEDLVLLAAGVVAHRTHVPWWVVLISVYVAAIGADCMLYAGARHFGRALLARPWLRRLVTPAREARVHGLFDRYGARAVFVGRHLGGVRAIVFALSAIEGVPFRSFLMWDALAGLITIPVVFSLGYLFSAHAQAVALGLARAEHWLGFAVGLAALAFGVFFRSRRKLR